MRTGPVINESYAVFGQANERSENCANQKAILPPSGGWFFRVAFRVGLWVAFLAYSVVTPYV